MKDVLKVDGTFVEFCPVVTPPGSRCSYLPVVLFRTLPRIDKTIVFPIVEGPFGKTLVGFCELAPLLEMEGELPSKDEYDLYSPCVFGRIEALFGMKV